jgi:hypothetical protein
MVKTELHKNRYRNVILILMISLALAGIYIPSAIADVYNLPLHHSDTGENMSVCTKCHEDNNGDFPHKRFDHTKSFIDDHSTAAAQNENVCSMCHLQSFCSDCHGVGVELKPSIKNHADTKQTMPHRGDYLTRHRIDGRIDPTKCFSCHGSPKTQRSCSKCHG